MSVIDGAVSAPQYEGPVRTCIGCRKRASVSELLRVVAVEGRVVVDERRRMPGRGAWLHLDPGCLTTASRRRAFPRALRVSGVLAVDGVEEYFDRRLGSDRGDKTDTRKSRVLPR
nr:YlxR family protein [Haloechinothrix halophila]